MISTALQFTYDVLNQFIRNKFGLDEDKVVLNTIIEGNGSLPEKNQNKIVLSLINIERESLKPFYFSKQKLAGGNYSDTRPSERFNLDILVSANFDDYSETLKFLEAVISFFQMNIIMDSTSYATIPAGVGKLEFEVEKITYHQMHSLWTAMGAKYQPSIIYKMRLVTFLGNETTGIIPAINNSANRAAI